MDEEVLAAQTIQVDQSQDVNRTWTSKGSIAKTDQSNNSDWVRMRWSRAFGWPYLLVQLWPWGRVLNQRVSHDD